MDSALKMVQSFDLKTAILPDAMLDHLKAALFVVHKALSQK